MKHIFSIIMEEGLGLPTGIIAFWGTLVLLILTDDHTFNSMMGMLNKKNSEMYSQDSSVILSCEVSY